jgi:hypothetical protein
MHKALGLGLIESRGRVKSLGVLGACGLRGTVQGRLAPFPAAIAGRARGSQGGLAGVQPLSRRSGKDGLDERPTPVMRLNFRFALLQPRPRCQSQGAQAERLSLGAIPSRGQ